MAVEKRKEASSKSRQSPEQQQQQQQEETEAPPTRAAWARFALLQHGGLVLAIASVALLALGYDAGWLHNTTLCLCSAGLATVGLLMHETRPVRVSERLVTTF